MKNNFILISITSLYFFLSCQSLPIQENLKSKALTFISPFMGEAEQIHSLSKRTPATNSFVTVYLPNNEKKYIPEINYTFNQNKKLTETEIENLISYFFSQRNFLGFSGNNISHVSIKYVNENIYEGDRYIRFQQILTGRVGLKNYTSEIVGATLIAKISENKLISIITHFTEVPSLSPIFENPGFKFEFSDAEMAYFFQTLKIFPEKRKILTKYLENLLSLSGTRKVSFDGFLNKTLAEQRSFLNEVFGKLSAKSTMKMLIDLNDKKQISLVKYDQKWMFQITNYFLLPFQFDFEIPSSKTEKLKIKNLRYLKNTATIKAYRSPFYPNGKSIENHSDSAKAHQKFINIQDYFENTFAWKGIDGLNPGKEIILHTNNKTADFKENAAWISDDKVFVIGNGGDMFQNLDNSLSVLGHEYMHAVIDSSSRIAYRGQAGGINEHLADIIGATLNSELENNGIFNYAFAEDVLSTPLKVEKEKVLMDLLGKKRFSEEEKNQYQLNKFGIRHFYSPDFSVVDQISTAQLAEEKYPTGCEPSLNNDNCGVHVISGVPNKAAALIIAILGIQDTKELFFKTALFRLNQTPSFTDYMGQLYEQCLIMPKIKDRCTTILASFLSVGIKYKKESFDLSPPTPLKNSEKKYSLLKSSNYISEICGFVSQKGNQFKIIDGNINPTFESSSANKSNIEVIPEILKRKCACIQGQINQRPALDNSISNFFTQITGWRPMNDECLNWPSTKNQNKSHENDQLPSKICGWIKHDQTNKIITIIDNKFDPQISEETLNTKEKRQIFHDNECVCIHEKVKWASKNPYQTNSYYIDDIIEENIQVQSYEYCSQLNWY